MKVLLLMSIAFLAGVLGYSQTTDEEQIKETITQFASAADKQDVQELEEVLDGNYRVVMNQLMGSDGVIIVDKEMYLNKIRTKEWGGDKRKVDIGQITLNGKSATAKVTFKGKMTFVSLMLLVQDANGTWKMIGDIPTIL